jgi:2'-5' RNA ligase
MTNTELNEYYNTLYEDSIKKIISDNYQVDDHIDSTSDNRFGITLIIRPNILVKNNIQKFIGELKAIDPGQYYYPNSDIHLTVMSIISCNNGFELKNISIIDYIEMIKKSLKTKNIIKINFNGITASSSCIMVRGFFNDNTLNNIRENLRNSFKDSGLYQSIDKRYRLQTAHSTVVRFRKCLQSKNEYIRIIENYRDYDFGSFTADTLELVYNDWYQRKEYVKSLYKFRIF